MHWIRCLAGLALMLALPLNVRSTEDEDAPEPKKPLPLEVAGVTVTPHANVQTMHFRQAVPPLTGARVQLFLRNPAPTNSPVPDELDFNVVTFDDQEPQRLLSDGEWSWHDTPAVWTENETKLPPGSLVVWTFNGSTPAWTSGKELKIGVTDWLRAQRSEFTVKLPDASVHLAAVTFLSTSNHVHPNQIVLHIANDSDQAVQIAGIRLHLPRPGSPWRRLFPQPLLTNLACFPRQGWIAAHDQGGASITVAPLPLIHAALEVILKDRADRPRTLWAFQRIKREVFDISGGWVAAGGGPMNPLTQEPFLKTLKRLHVNTAHLQLTPGYTDTYGPGSLYARYPLKLFGAMQPLAAYDTDAMLPRLHAVEFLGEPQYEGGDSQRLPQEVWHALAPYATHRLPTTVTLSDPSTWSAYAGLSDYPHFDAYRVAAPAADIWPQYDRWGKDRIAWGAPLETIGDMCRSLRETSRPAPVAAWSQGPHHAWELVDGRKRAAPNPDEIRLQAYHALSSRITSLYWFNLSLPALVKYRDTLPALERIGREIRMLDDFYLEGSAYRHQSLRRESRPDWDLASIVSPRGAVLTALDLDYAPDRSDKRFEFRRPREARFSFALPAWLRPPQDVFRLDAEGIYDVKYTNTVGGVEIVDRQNKVALYVAAASRELRAELERKRQALLIEERLLNFDPGANPKDFEILKALWEPK